MTEKMKLSNNLLIAMPSLRDMLFSQTVIYICEQHPQETIGLIINKPINYPITQVFEQLGVIVDSTEQNNKPLIFGGPIQPQRGFVLHRPRGNWSSSLVITPDVTITTSNDIIRAIAHDKGPQDALIALGYVVWNDNQLEEEIMQNYWLLSPFKPELLYDVPFNDRWKVAGELLGVNMDQIISGSGHA
jgi:putative transcriptional regulator